MFIKNFSSTSTCLILATIQKIQSFLIQPITKVIGKFKDVSEGKIIDEFVGLRSKKYSMKNIDGKESNTTKGVKIKTEFNEFRDTLFNKKVLRHSMKRIEIKKHKIGPYEINKKSLSRFDDKRFVLDDGVHALAYFHKDSRKKIFTNKNKCT